ncbi:uncharacterized protein THITE_2119381 [Thermothielavioides terrestris NRRL 8126]|uniref:Uncharacterized protein n=1 Tax=Thermothielavioides terrestris (strain ATCC 38088 / NRRL 8126) TaxID=578455 RepID=G2RBQ4_THETT|nr:uncharacterized protein THITE_2119381 [Thermothielavioides terrestris NRRL 8126]AEO69225.1 hypothetical protein THITE_2119381 [Thermothielavioides terrestris NRRL 8126]
MPRGASRLQATGGIEEPEPESGRDFIPATFSIGYSIPTSLPSGNLLEPLRRLRKMKLSRCKQCV